MHIFNDTFIHISWENGGNYTKLLRVIKTKKVSQVVIFGPQEHSVLNFDEDVRKSKSFDNYVKQKNIELIRIVGTPIGKKLNPLYYMNHRPNIYSWDTFFANSTVYDSLFINSVEPVGHGTIKKHFISLNRKPHPHRCMFIDLMHKHELQDFGMTSWHSFECTQYPYDFKHWTPRILELEEPNLNLHNLSLSNPHPSFQETLFSVICESSPDLIFCTEKTYVPIYHRRPFLIFGSKNIHAYLKRLNFKLFDEIIDYSFDKIDDPYERFDAGMLQLKKICEIEPNELLKVLKPKIDHNFVNLLNIFKNAQTYVDNKVIEVVSYDIPSMEYYRNLLYYGQTPAFENIYEDMIKRIQE